MERLRLSFSFFDAVDGETLLKEEIDDAYDKARNARDYKHQLSGAEIGCYISHLALWRQIAEGDAPGGVILEDDFLPDPRFPQLLAKISRLGLSDCIIKFHAEKWPRGETLCNLGDGFRLIAPETVPGLALGYAIGREAAKRLTANAAPFARPVDMDLKHWWEFGAPILLVEPPVLKIDKTGEESRIEMARGRAKAAGFGSSVRRFGRNLRYQLRFQWAKRRARAESRRAIARIKRQIAERT